VDDNPPMAETLDDILTLKGYEVHVAYSGSDALKILQRQQIDILLTDIIMPDMNGVELYRHARRTHPQMVTFLMTAYADDDIIEQAIAEGVRTVLDKPLDINRFLRLLEELE
jgi:CheY-like chemotaxis protein